MPRLFLLLLSISVGTFAGIGVVIALVMGHYAWQPMLVAAAIGAALSVPVTWFVAKKIAANDPISD